MILYYTASQKTKTLAETLGGLLGLPPYELQSPLNAQKLFKLRALWLGITAGEALVSNMPKSLGDGPVYLCAPVWAGHAAAPAEYFLRRANLKDAEVTVLLTCRLPDESYRKPVEELLTAAGCKSGRVLQIVTGKEWPPERNLLRTQLKEMLGLTD